MGKRTIEGDSPVSKSEDKGGSIRSNTRHVKSRMKTWGPPHKAKYYLVTDSDEYREGKVKRTPGGE